MWALAPSAMKRVESVFHSLGPQNATGYPTAPTEIVKSNSSNVHPQTNALSPPQSPQSISPSHFSAGDHTHHNIKYLEQLLESSLATVAVIQFSGNTLADVLSPRAYNTFKALYALADLDAPALSSKARESEIPIRSTFSDIGNDCAYSSNHSPLAPFPNSSLAVPHTNRIQISISDNIMLFSWAGLVAVSFSVLFLICFYYKMY